MSEKKRMANYELLRAVAMLMILLMHFLSHSGSLLVAGSRESFNGVTLLGTVLEFFSIAAVNTYVLISGFFGVKTSFRPAKAVSLLFQIWFYALLVPLALRIIFPEGLPLMPEKAVGAAGLIVDTGARSAGQKIQGIYKWIWYLFPIETEHYWFATSYFILYLLTPVLNGAVRAMSKKQLQITLGGLLILFCGMKSMSPVVFAFDKYGYDPAWFICVYLVAAYLGLYGHPVVEKRGWAVYVGSSIGCIAIHLGMFQLSLKSDSWGYYFSVPYHYNFLLCLLAAIGLFYGFSKLQIREGCLAAVIRKTGVLCFGVYLLHEHVDLRYRWYWWIRNWINPSGKTGIGVFFWELSVCVVILFTAGIFIDYVRSIFFKAAGKLFKNTAACRFLQRLDEEMGTGGQEGMGE